MVKHLWSTLASTLALAFLVRLTVLLLSVSVLFFAEEFHQQLLPRDPQASAAHHALLDYLRGTATLEQTSERAALTPEEASHIQDVKRRVNVARVLLAVLLVIVTGFVIVKPRMLDVKKAFFWSGISGIVLVIVLVVIPYDVIFTLFHASLFEQGTWLFPVGTTLANLYGGSFFQITFRAIMAVDFFMNLVITGFAWLALRKAR